MEEFIAFIFNQSVKKTHAELKVEINKEIEIKKEKKTKKSGNKRYNALEKNESESDLMPNQKQI